MRDTADKINDFGDHGWAALGDPVEHCSAQKSGFTHLQEETSHASDFADRDILAGTEAQTTLFKFANGTTAPVNWNFRDTYRDEYTAEPLPDAQIRHAFVDEMRYVNGVVWKGIPLAEAPGDRDGKLLNGRWFLQYRKPNSMIAEQKMWPAKWNYMTTCVFYLPHCRSKR